MVFFLGLGLFWGLGLFFFRPIPENLKMKIPSRWDDFKKVQVTFWLGIVLSTIFFIFSNGTFTDFDEKWFNILGINNVKTFSPLWFSQTITSNFIHIDIIHLLMNLSFLGLLSLYERIVGGKRFITVFIVSGIFSSFSILLNSEHIISGGASAGLFGLGGAFFLDKPKLNLKEYIIGLALISFIYLVLRFQTEIKIGEDYNIDEWGHISGLILGLVFCKLFPIQIKENNQKPL